MLNNDHRYIYYEDKFGSVIGYILDVPTGTDNVSIGIIAEKIKDTNWNTKTRGTFIMVDLKKVKIKKFYENYEEFCEDYFDAIL